MAKVLIFGTLKSNRCSQELLGSVGSLQFSSGKAEIFDVNRCVGDVSFLIFVFILYVCSRIDDDPFFL